MRGLARASRHLQVRNVLVSLGDPGVETLLFRRGRTVATSAGNPHRTCQHVEGADANRNRLQLVATLEIECITRRARTLINSVDSRQTTGVGVV